MAIFNINNSYKNYENKLFHINNTLVPESARGFTYIYTEVGTISKLLLLFLPLQTLGGRINPQRRRTARIIYVTQNFHSPLVDGEVTVIFAKL